MKIKCCGQSRNQKGGTTLTELEIVARRLLVEKSVLLRLGITKKVLERMDRKELKTLLDGLHGATSDAVTRLEELDGLRM